MWSLLDWKSRRGGDSFDGRLGDRRGGSGEDSGGRVRLLSAVYSRRITMLLAVLIPSS